MTSRKERNNGKRRRKLRVAPIIIMGLILAVAAGLFVNFLTTGEKAEDTPEKAVIGTDVKNQTLPESNKKPEPKEEPKVETTIKISAAGDFAIGTDESFGYDGTFGHEADKSGLSHFVGGLNDIFKNDDLTTVNLETTLTTATKKAAKKFRFKETHHMYKY